MTNRTYTRAEIDQQSQAWALTLSSFAGLDKKRAKNFLGPGTRTWVPTDCGSTHYASLNAAAMMRRLGLGISGRRNCLFHRYASARAG